MANSVAHLMAQLGLIGVVVFAQALLLVVAIAATAVFLVTRSLWLKYRLAKQNEYGKLLIELLFEPIESTRKFLSLSFWQERIFRDVLLHQIRILSGDERAALVKLYDSAGYLKEDRRLLRSRAWGVRLRALIRMDLLSLGENRDSFLNSMSDHNTLVALCATRAFSRLKDEVADDFLFSTLVRVSAHQHEASVEVLSNIGSNSGIPHIISYLEKNPGSPIAVACVKVLGDLRAVEASSVFLQIINTPEIFSDDLISAVLEGLRKIADPAGLDLAKQTLRHTSPRVRAKSIHFVQEVGGSFSPEEREFLNRDSSIEVQRALQMIEDQERAA